MTGNGPNNRVQNAKATCTNRRLLDNLKILTRLVKQEHRSGRRCLKISRVTPSKHGGQRGWAIKHKLVQMRRKWKHKLVQVRRKWEQYIAITQNGNNILLNNSMIRVSHCSTHWCPIPIQVIYYPNCQ